MAKSRSQRRAHIVPSRFTQRGRGLRPAIAASLLESLDPLMDDDVESAWQAEIQKRLHEIETGTVSLVPWSEVRKMLDLDE